MVEFSEARSSSAEVCVGLQRRNALPAGSIDRLSVVVRPSGCAHTTVGCRMIEKGSEREEPGRGWRLTQYSNRGRDRLDIGLHPQGCRSPKKPDGEQLLGCDGAKMALSHSVDGSLKLTGRGSTEASTALRRPGGRARDSPACAEAL